MAGNGIKRCIASVKHIFPSPFFYKNIVSFFIKKNNKKIKIFHNNKRLTLLIKECITYTKIDFCLKTKGRLI